MENSRPAGIFAAAGSSRSHRRDAATWTGGRRDECFSRDVRGTNERELNAARRRGVVLTARRLKRGVRWLMPKRRPCPSPGRPDEAVGF
ncbi:hypothetical protein NL676_010263 [Syzygium grande]|nr:hypothetical protein NL676_010263 [Syzygium grande]